MKKLFTLLLMLCAVLSTRAATPAKLYIVGQANVGIGNAGWVYTPASSGCMEMTKDGNKFTASVKLTGTAWFCFGEQDGSSWDNFNDNYSWRPNSNNLIPTEGTPVPMSHGRNNSFKLGQGEYTFTVDFSGSAPTFTLSGKAEEVVITGYSLIGAKELFGGNGWDTDVDLTETSTGVYTATVSNVSLAAGSYEYKARANKTWGIAEYPSSDNNSLTIAEAGTYNIVFTLTLATSTLTAEATKVGEDAPEVTDLYIVGSMNEWKTQDENLKMTKQTDGTYYFFIEDLKASETEPVNFKFIDNLNQWYGSTNLEEGEEIGPDNCDDIALSTAQSVTNNFIIKGNAKNVKITVDLANMKFSVDAEDGTETTVEAPEHLYLLGNVQGWDPSSGSAEMTRTKMDSDKVKYKYEFTGYFPAGDDAGNTYFSFITALASASDAWGELDGKRYGANEDGEAITADNTVPYDLKAGGNAFKLAEGYYRIELNWKEDGPDIAMWVHTEAAPEITDLYLVGEFNSWAAQDANYKFTKREDGKFEFTMNGYVANQKFKFVDNNGTWYGSATWKDEAITEDNCDNIALGVGGVDNNFYALTNGSAVLTVDLSAMTFSVEPTEVVLPKEATYIEGKNFAYFEAPATWGETVYAYTFEAGEGVAAKAPRKVSAAWPGDAMELVTTSAAGNKVYRYTTEDTDFNTIIFTDGTNQTADLAFSNAGYYMAVGLVATVPSTSTGIDSLTDQTATQTSAQMYTIDGRRVNAPLSKGLYITNGKKVMIGK